ncbi:MAG: hypothetical protein ACYDDU_18830 [Dermatophilaceae bacterium]
MFKYAWHFMDIVFGLVVGVVFEDTLKHSWHTVRIRARSLFTRGKPQLFDKQFELGPLRTGFIPIEGDGDRIIAESNVHLLVDPHEVILPADLLTWRQEELERMEQTKGGNWNGLRYAVAGGLFITAEEE